MTNGVPLEDEKGEEDYDEVGDTASANDTSGATSFSMVVSAVLAFASLVGVAFN